MSAAIAERLEALLPLFESGRATHVEWRDWLLVDPARERVNPHAGNAKFHAEMVVEYDERIAAVKEAVAYIRSKA